MTAGTFLQGGPLWPRGDLSKMARGAAAFSESAGGLMGATAQFAAAQAQREHHSGEELWDKVREDKDRPSRGSTSQQVEMIFSEMIFSEMIFSEMIFSEIAGAATISARWADDGGHSSRRSQRPGSKQSDVSLGEIVSDGAVRLEIALFIVSRRVLLMTAGTFHRCSQALCARPARALY